MRDKTEAELVREIAEILENDPTASAQMLKGADMLKDYACLLDRASHEPNADLFAGQAMPGDESPVSQLEIVSAINHHARELARLTETWPAPPATPEGGK